VFACYRDAAPGIALYVINLITSHLLTKAVWHFEKVRPYGEKEFSYCYLILPVLFDGRSSIEK
jgi:hypothetical protein